MLPMMLGVDHIAISAGHLQEGVEYIETALGVPLEAGGSHLRFGTHNMLLNLGELYLEVIAIDPQVKAPFAPRWFDLDRFSGRPRPTNWICRTEAMRLALEAALPQTGPSVAVNRGDLNWLISVPETGILPFDNMAPALIDWLGIPSPAQKLPDRGCRLRQLKIAHPQAELLAAYLAAQLQDNRVLIEKAARPQLSVCLSTPTGEVVLE